MFSMKKRFLIIMSALLLSFSLVSCGTEKATLRDEFVKFHVDSNNKIFTTSRGTEMYVSDLGKENDSFEQRVVLSLWIGNTEPGQKLYNWCQLPIEERKLDLKECGDMVIEFAKNKGWDNNYYLYINVETIGSSHDYVYDYEDDELYIPDDEQIYCKMYEQFGTMSSSKLEELDGGIDFLVNNGLAYIKHNEVEYHTVIGGGVSIYEGEFSISLDDEDYTVY